jgi:hypothetical protein
MSDGPDLVSLLYRADWARLSLTAEVSVTRDRDLWRSRFDDGPPPRARIGGQFGPRSVPWFAPWFGPPPGVGDQESGVPGEPWESPEQGEPGFGRAWVPGHEWEVATEVLGTESSRFTLLIAPGRRYREQGEDYLSGCDGERSWLAMQDDGGWSVEAAGGPERPPEARMLRPSWLLTGFTLEPGGPASVSGRDALRVVATPRSGIKAQLLSRRRPLDRVEVAVDTDLGILLRCEEILHGRPLRHPRRERALTLSVRDRAGRVEMLTSDRQHRRLRPQSARRPRTPRAGHSADAGPGVSVGRPGP